MDISGISAADLTARSQPTTQAAERIQLVAAMRSINDDNIFGEDNELTFVVDRSTQQMVFRVIDRATHDVVMQLPPESVLQLAADLQGDSAGRPDSSTT